MVEPLSTTALVGAGWFANKVFGPSADELGTQLRAFVNTKLRAIVERAERKVDPKNVGALSPGFIYNFSQKASFSDDDPQITEMWASLLASASEGQNYHHSIFTDILTQIGSGEAQILQDLCPNPHDIHLGKFPPDDLRRHLYYKFKGQWDGHALSSEAAKARSDELLKFDFGWPVRVRMASYPEKYEDEKYGSASATLLAQRGHNDFSIDVLCRQRVLDVFEFDAQPGWLSPMMDGYMITLLGLEFMKACNRPNLDSKS